MSTDLDVRTSYTVHPLAELLPEMTPEEFSGLCASLLREGLIHPIVLYDEQILDGRNRQAACEETGVQPRYVHYAGDTPASFVLAANVERRHLSTSQKAMLATAFLPELEVEANGRRGARTDLTCPPIGGQVEHGARRPAHSAAADAAQAVGVGTKTVERAKRVANQRPDLAEKVRAGAMTVDAAERQLKKDIAVPAPTAPAPIAEPMTPRQTERAEAHKRKLNQLIATLEGAAIGAPHIDVNRARTVMTAEEIDQWSKSLAHSLAGLRQLRTDLQEGRQQ